MSKRPPRPQGYPWLSPYLVVKDPDAAIAFYQKAFGFEKRMALTGPEGRTGHVEMTWQEAVIMFGPECAMGQSDHKPPAASKVRSISLYVYCNNVDALFERAVAAGAKAIKPPQDQFYGDRSCTLEDPDGYWWYFATNVADFPAHKAT